MAGLSGIELFSALRHATAWGTPVACGAGDGFYSKATTLRDECPIEVDDSVGLYHSADGSPGLLTLGGDIPLTMHYQGLELLYWLVTGNGGVYPDIPYAGSTTCLYHPVKDPGGCFATLARYMINYVYEVPSLKATGFTLKGQAGKVLTITFHVQGNVVNRNTTTGTNTLATAANITMSVPIPPRPVRFSEGFFQLKDQAAPALDSGDRVYPSEFEFTYKRNLGGIATNRNIDEPTNDGRPECTLKLTFPRHTSVTRLTELGADTRKKGAFTFQTWATVPWMFLIQMPHLQYSKIPVTDAQGIIQEPVEFICHASDGTVPGMTNLTAPFYIQQTNQLATAPWLL